MLAGVDSVHDKVDYDVACEFLKRAYWTIIIVPVTSSIS